MVHKDSMLTTPIMDERLPGFRIETTREKRARAYIGCPTTLRMSLTFEAELQGKSVNLVFGTIIQHVDLEVRVV